MTELKRATENLEEVQVVLVSYLSVKEAGSADHGKTQAVERDLCAKMKALEEKVVKIETRYNTSIQGNGSIYGPKTTAKITLFLESFRALQQTMCSNELDYVTTPGTTSNQSSSVIEISTAAQALFSSKEESSGGERKGGDKRVEGISGKPSHDPNELIGKLVSKEGERFSDAQLNQAIQQQESMTEKIASLPPGMVRDAMSTALIEIQRCLNRIEKKRTEELERSRLLHVHRLPQYNPPGPGYPYAMPPYPGYTPLPTPGFGPGGHFGGDLLPGGGFGGQGGSLLGPRHPLFNGDDFRDVGGKGRGGRPPGAPPGARFDPFGPGVPGFGGHGRGGPPGLGFPGTEPYI